MLEVFQNSIWQFVGAVLTLIGIVASCLFYFAQRRKKSLSYQIIYEAKLFHNEPGYADKFKVTYRGKDVDEVGIIAIRIVNDGNQPILKSDFESPLRFEFSASVTLLSVDVTQTRPKNLRIFTSLDENSLTLEPLLLNKQDTIELDVLLEGGQTEIVADARIIGISDVKRTNGEDLENRKKTVLFFGSVGILAWVGAYLLTGSVVVGVLACFVSFLAYTSYRMYLATVGMTIKETRGSVLK